MPLLKKLKNYSNKNAGYVQLVISVLTLLVTFLLGLLTLINQNNKTTIYIFQYPYQINSCFETKGIKNFESLLSGGTGN